MGCNLFGGCGRRHEDDFPRRRPCNHCGSFRRFESDRDRFDDRFCPGCRSEFRRNSRFY